eukprot:gene35123-42539_t
MSSSKVPVTVLTGFLGSGKTTLVNHILANNKGRKFAVIENEFGDVGVDNQLIGKNLLDTDGDEIVEMMNGCICCTVRADLVKVLKKLLIEEKRAIDAILIETTGLADPAPVAQTFFVDPEIAEVCYLDAIVTVVDAKHLEQHLDDNKPDGVENEAIEQLAFADRVLLNKTDLVSESDLERVRNRIRSINSTAKVIPCTQSAVDVHEILGIKSFDLDRILDMDAEFLQADGVEHQHDNSIVSVSLQLQEPVSVGSLEEWISSLIRTQSNNLFRYKGIINVIGMEQKFIFQGIHMLFRGDFLGSWKDGETRCSSLVFIGRKLNKKELLRSFRMCIPQPLRFTVGTKVLACLGAGRFEEGIIIKTWDEGNPYRIRLYNGDEVWGPVDTDELVRLAPVVSSAGNL